MELTAAGDRFLSSGRSSQLRKPFDTALVFEGFFIILTDHQRPDTLNLVCCQ